MLRAKTTFFAPGRRVVAGDLFTEDDPVVKGREGLFETLEVPAPARGGQRPKPDGDGAQSAKPTARKSTTAARKGAGGAGK